MGISVSVEVVLLFLVGLVPWITLNSVFLQLPILLAKVPEGYAVATRLVLVVQLGNVPAFGLAYALTRTGGRIPARAVAGVLCLVNGAVAVLIGLFWDSFSLVGESPQSVALLTLTALSGAVGCIGVVTLHTWAGPIGRDATTAVATGMSVNGLLGALLAIVQQPGPDAHFGVAEFMWLPVAISALGLVCVACWQTAVGAFDRRAQSPPQLHIQSKQGLLEEFSRPSSADSIKSHRRAAPGDGLASVFVADTPSGPLWRIHVLMFVWCAIFYFLMGYFPYCVRGYESGLATAFVRWGSIASTAMTSVGNVTSRWVPLSAIRLRGAALAVGGGCFVVLVVAGARTELLFPGTGGGVALDFLYGALSFLYGVEQAIFFQLAGAASDPRASTATTVVAQSGAAVGSLVSTALANWFL